MDELPTVYDVKASEDQWHKTLLLDSQGRNIFWKRPIGFTRPNKEYFVSFDEDPVELSHPRHRNQRD